jgi:hypothetical protein
MENYISAIQTRQVGLRSRGSGYCLSECLATNNATRVVAQDGCIVITFGFLPPDAVPQLIYSSTGFSGLPSFYKHQNAAGPAFFMRTPVDDKWSYCLWDD